MNKLVRRRYIFKFHAKQSTSCTLRAHSTCLYLCLVHSAPHRVRFGQQIGQGPTQQVTEIVDQRISHDSYFQTVDT
jgi:hypothetical protein